MKNKKTEGYIETNENEYENNSWSKQKKKIFQPKFEI